MPHVIAAYLINFFWANAVFAAVINTVVYGTFFAILSAAQRALQPDQPSSKPQSAGMEVTSTNSAAAMEVVYGRVRKGGVNIIPPWTHGANSNSLSQIIAMAGHEVTAFSGNYIDADLLPIEAINTISVSSASGAVNSGILAGLIRVRDYRGLASNSQFVDYELFTAFPTQCTSWFRGAGIAYTAASYDWGDGKFWGQRGVPVLTADLFGKKVYDPRRDTTPGANPTSATYAFPSSNPALCWADFKVNTIYGRQVPTAEIDWNAVVTAANICDTPVAAPGVGSFLATGVGATSSTNADGSTRIQRTSSSGWNASVYSTVVANPTSISFSPNNQTGEFLFGLSKTPTAGTDDATINFGWHINANTTVEIKELGTVILGITDNYSADGTKLYDALTTYAIEWDGVAIRYFINDRLVRTTVPATSTGTLGFDSSMNNATVDVDLNVERRYTCNGVLNSASDANDNERVLIDAMVGHLCRKGGLWTCYAGAFVATTFSLQKTDWISIDAIQLTSGREAGRYNGVRCYYLSPLRNWQRVECYPRYDDTYKSQDAGERIWLEMEQPMCTHEYEAQRKAQFLVRASRNGIRVVGTLPPKFLNIATFDTVTFTFEELGWSSKVFRVLATTLNTDGSQNVTLAEEQSTDWTDLVVSEYNSNTIVNLPSLTATTPTEPNNFGVSTVLNQVSVSWDVSSVQPEGTQYQIYSAPTSLSLVTSKTLLWEGVALSKLLSFSATSPYYLQGRARANSYYSGFTPNTYGTKINPSYTAPTSTGGWSFSVSPVDVSKSAKTATQTTAYASGIVVNTVATPVFSWVNAGSMASATILFPGSSSTYFSATGLAIDENRNSDFYCNVNDGGNVSSKAVTVDFTRTL